MNIFPVTLKMFYIWYMENCKQYLKSGLTCCLETLTGHIAYAVCIVGFIILIFSVDFVQFKNI